MRSPCLWGSLWCSLSWGLPPVWGGHCGHITDSVRQTSPCRIRARNGIDPARYTNFQRRLNDLKLIEFSATREYVAFVRDGLTDNLDGLLYVREGSPLPTELHPLPRLVALRHLGGNWYRFGTT